MNSRRIFLAGAGAAAMNQLVQPRAFGANDKIRVAVLGVNGRGMSHIAGIQAQPDAEVAILCDPDSVVLAKRAGEFEKKFGRKVQTETDLRRVFDNKEIDAVTIATPNHWHALAAIWACQAGKDVYVEKPGAHSIYEGRKLVEAAHKYKRIVQHGVQLRSPEAIQEAVALLRKSEIGKVYMSRGLVYRWRPSIGHKPDEAPPSTLNYDIWQGPAQLRAFSKRIVHYNWHWHWDYGNGDVGNQGIHETGMCMWGLGVDTLPSKVTSMGGKFLFDDDKETPGVGNIIYGSEGYLVIKGYTTYEVYKGQKKEKLSRTSRSEKDHFTNFIKAVRSRKTSDQNGPVETAHLSSALAHLGNISCRLGRQLDFDPKTERFPHDEQANAMLKRNYRAPYVVPEKV
jgi:predicted dehydrogenase